MARGPYYRLLPVYRLDFEDTQGSFFLEAHLEEKRQLPAAITGLDAKGKNLEILFCNPREGSPRVKHDMEASITPSFDGLEGTLKIDARPRSEYKAVTKAEGLLMYGTFTQDPGSVDEGVGWEVWERRRFVADGGETLTGGPSGEWQPETLKLQFVSERGDEADDYAAVTVYVIGIAGRLEVGDRLAHPVHGRYRVRGVENQGQYERARLLR